MGIWQDVRVKFGNELEIVDTHVITDLPLPDTTSVNFIVQTEIYNSSKTTRTANLHFNIGGLRLNPSVESQKSFITNIPYSSQSS